MKTPRFQRNKTAARRHAATSGEIDRFRLAHMELGTREVMTDAGLARVLVNDSESPLAWLARRKGRDGATMISPAQFVAGEKLRADFTYAQMTPRVTSSWAAPTGQSGPGGRGAGEITDTIVAARQRVRLALQACGPEFSGVLMDVCCFLRGLEDVERERCWPSRSAKVVLQLALDRLARHYGLGGSGDSRSARLQSWLADDATFTTG